MKKNMSRREFMRIAGLASGASILAACAPSTTTTTAPEGTEAGPGETTEGAPAADTVTVTFTGWGGAEENDGVLAAAEYFEGENPDIKINWIQIPENYAEKLLAMVAAGTPPDTAFCYNTIYQDYVSKGLLMDITANLEADPVVGAPDYFIEPQEKDRCTVDGKWYGIGSCWVAGQMYYNADIFEAEGIEPPSNDPDEAWEWDKFLEVARQLTTDANGKHPGEDGFDPDNIERWGVQWPQNNLVFLHSAVADNGGRWINPETGLVELDSPEASEGLQNVADLMLVEHVAPRGAAFSALGLTNTQMLENGTLAMAIDGSWALSWITKINANLGTATLPRMKSLGTDMQAHIHVGLAGSENPDQAWQWLRFLATEYYQLIFLKMGLWLPSQTALMTPEGMEKWYTERKGPGDGIHPAGYDKIVTKFVPEYGHVLYMPPGYTEADAVITPALDAVWVGDETAQMAMETAVPEANAILEEAKA
ncbi:MAG: sugar ABC transporter substrate-binding protein [Anaerolineae bacterium]|nr:sugar ABC transporter substrate-binding protein [Anaerolineae bacterium]